MISGQLILLGSDDPDSILFCNVSVFDNSTNHFGDRVFGVSFGGLSNDEDKRSLVEV